MNCRAGSGRISPRLQIRAAVVPGRDQLAAQAGRLDQAGALGPAGEQRLGAHVHRAAGHLGHGQLAARPRRAVQHDDVGRLVAQEERRGEAGDTRADNGDDRPGPGLFHPFTLWVRDACSGYPTTGGPG